jgi:hypothetical protein
MDTQEVTQESGFGSRGWRRCALGLQLAARDPLFALVLLILAVALGGTIALGRGPAEVIISAGVFFGVLQLRRGALWFVVVLGSIGVLYLTLVLFNVVRGSAAASLTAIPINVFVIWVLLDRRSHFLRGR